MNILVIGGGGREHALVWKLKQSQGVDAVFCSPGNGGIGRDAAILPAYKDGDWDAIADMIRKNRVDLTVVGPEAPLVGGIVDALKAKGLKVFGPEKAAARLEGSKIFAKNFMRKYGIPTADFEVFDDASKALDHISASRFPLVVKADGLAAGKGVSVCRTREEAAEAVENMLAKKVFGAAGEKILIEEGLVGEEISLMALCDGKSIKSLVAARDYKRVFDGNLGPNTGGMGAVAPSPVPQGASHRIEKEIVQRFLDGIQKENLDYRGLIYFGIMLTPKGPQALEFNVRFGDPETEAVLPLVKSDLARLFLAVSDQKLGETPLEFHDRHCVTVVCASKGYPGKFETHKEIAGLDAASDAMVFHSGTVSEGGKTFTHGGRVLNCAALGKTFDEAKSGAYALVKKISFEGMHFRSDIGASNSRDRGRT